MSSPNDQHAGAGTAEPPVTSEPSATAEAPAQVEHAEVVEAPAASDGEAVEQPAKVMRIGSMMKQLLDEVRNTDLDEASRDGACSGLIGHTGAQHCELVAFEARHRVVYRAIRAQTRQVRRHLHHIEEPQEWRGRKLVIALLKHLAAILDETLVTVGIRLTSRPDLGQHRLAIPVVVEAIAVFPEQSVKG